MLNSREFFHITLKCKYNLYKDDLYDDYKFVSYKQAKLKFNINDLNSEEQNVLDNFKKKVSDNLALDGGEYLTYLAPSVVNLNLAIERWPEITFTKTREH